MVQLVSNGTVGFTNATNDTIRRVNDTIGIFISTNGITNVSIGRTMNDINLCFTSPMSHPNINHLYFIAL